MRVLIITSGCNPSGSGFSLRVHSLAQMASRIADVSVLSIYDPYDPKIAGVKFYHRAFPEGAFSRLARLATYYRTRFQPIGMNERPDVVQIESPALFGLAKQFPGTPVILDEHNVWWQLEEYNMQQGPTLKTLPFKRLLTGWLLGRAKRYELNALKKSSAIIVCSKNDAGEIAKELPQVKGRIGHIPNCLDTERYMAEESDRDIVLFMGSLIYFPNIDALKLICREIAPKVNAEFQILGEGRPDIEVPPNVKILGRVDDVRPYVGRAKICIAPLRYGSGSRLKILEYMAIGKPVVSTAKGAEGLEVEPGKNIFVEDDMGKTAALVNRLLKDANLRKAVGMEARKLVEEKYDYRLYCDELKKIYEKARR